MPKQPRQYWLMKTEPQTFSWQDLAEEGRTVWDGVRNYQARNNMREMREGDLTFVYHSVGPRTVVGVARIARAAYPDPTAEGDRWSAVDLVPAKALAEPVTLAAIKADELLQEIALVRHSRLSVMPLRDFEFERILELGKTKLPRKV